MKRIFTLFLLIACMACSNASAQAVIEFKKATHNFGTFSEKTPVKAVFKFKNTGDKPLVIQQVVTSCGCTVADYTKTKVEPGKEGEVSVTYDGKGKAKGSFRKNIIVRTNASNNPVRLWITGFMNKED